MKINDLYDLIDKNINDKIIQDFVSETEKSETDNIIQTKEIKEFKYINSIQRGWSLCFKNNILESIYLYTKLKPPNQEYKGKLPYGINFSLFNEDIIGFFGDSKQKGGGTDAIWIAYDHIGLEINFYNKEWNDQKNPITFIVLFNKNYKGGVNSK